MIDQAQLQSQVDQLKTQMSDSLTSYWTDAGAAPEDAAECGKMCSEISGIICLAEFSETDEMPTTDPANPDTSTETDVPTKSYVLTKSVAGKWQVAKAGAPHSAAHKAEVAALNESIQAAGKLAKALHTKVSATKEESAPEPETKQAEVVVKEFSLTDYMAIN